MIPNLNGFIPRNLWQCLFDPSVPGTEKNCQPIKVLVHL